MAKDTYVAFLRGINVGGKKVSMATLKTCFEDLGFKAVKTYINSGNVVFVNETTKSEGLALKIEKALNDTFKFPISVVVKNLAQMSKVVEAIPAHWHGNDSLRRNVIFLRPSI